MPELVQIEVLDRRLLASVAAALGEAARRSGDWLVCRPGCVQCCMGPFEITALDALRLRRGFAGLTMADSARAERLRARLQSEDDSDDAPCPVLDPETGLCDLYEHRPITCRTFGPATRIGDGALAACELCYSTATDDQIAGCAVEIDPEGLEDAMLSSLAAPSTSVAQALRPHPQRATPPDPPSR